MPYEGETWFDMESAGFLPNYGFQGGPGRVVFDAQTRVFKRMERLGGDPHATQPLIESDAQDASNGG